MADLQGGTTGYPAAVDTYTEETSADNTDYNPVNGAANAVVAIEGELGTNPSGGKATVALRISQEHDTDGEHTMYVPHDFFQDNVAASQSAVALVVGHSATVTEFEMPWAGSIVGIQIVSNEARTADTLTVDATINGTVSGLQAVLDGTNTTHHSSTQAKDTDAFNAGDRVGCKITTGGSWTPTTADIAVTVYVSFNS